jgi:excisionase family DNA binding protein
MSDTNRTRGLGELLTVAEVARQLRVDDTTVRRWIKHGVFEAVVLPHRNARQAYRIQRTTLDALLGGQLPELSDDASAEEPSTAREMAG